jgi:hypothetical protein
MKRQVGRWSGWERSVGMNEIGQVGWELVSIYSISEHDGESNAGFTMTVYTFK